MNLRKYLPEFFSAVKRGKYEVDGNVILLNRKSVKLRGFYIEGLRGGPYYQHENLLVDQGILSLLSIGFGGTAKHAGFYLAPFSGGASPAANWTAANFTSNATEITSLSEGFSNVTRPACTFGTASAGAIDNYAALAAFTVACTTQITVTGLGLLTSSTRGGTSGTLMSAVKFTVSRVLNNTDTWDAGYQIQLTDS